MREDPDELSIAQWIFEGENQNAKHLIVVWDALDRRFKPFYVRTNDNLEEKRTEYGSGNYRVFTEYRL